jgi:hypothetical protein
VTTPAVDPDNHLAALAAERVARQEAEARASSAEAMLAYLKLLIAKMKRERFGQSAERGRQLLDQLELQLEELETTASEDETAEPATARSTTVHSFTRKTRCGRRCQRICRASGWSSRRRALTRAAAASWSRWARTSTRPWR